MMRLAHQHERSPRVCGDFSGLGDVLGLEPGKYRDLCLLKRTLHPEGIDGILAPLPLTVIAVTPEESYDHIGNVITNVA